MFSFLSGFFVCLFFVLTFIQILNMGSQLGRNLGTHWFYAFHLRIRMQSLLQPLCVLAMCLSEYIDRPCVAIVPAFAIGRLENVSREE